MSIDFSSSTYPIVEANKVARSSSGDSTLIKGRLSGVQDDGFFPAFSASGQDVWHDKYRHEGTAIILSAVGARCGKCFFAKGKWSAIANTHVIWPNENLIDPEYLHHILNNESFWIRGGSAQPFVKVRDSLKQPIPVPPLEEQRRIVARIKECLERVEEIERLRAEANAEREALFPSLLAEAYTRLSSFPMRTIGEVALESRYGTSRKCSTKEHGIPVLRIPNVIGGRITFSDLKYCSFEQKESDKLILKSGDLLFVRTNGSRDLVGRCAIFEPEDTSKDFAFASYLIRVRVDTEIINPRYLAFFLNSTHGRVELDKRRRTSAGQFNINSENLKNIELPVPPVHVQEVLVKNFTERLEEIMQLKAETQSSVQEQSHLRDAILRKAFAGEL